MSAEDNNAQVKGSIDSTSNNEPPPSESTKNNEPPTSDKTLSNTCTLQLPEEEQKTSNIDDLQTGESNVGEEVGAPKSPTKDVLSPSESSKLMNHPHQTKMINQQLKRTNVRNGNNLISDCDDRVSIMTGSIGSIDATFVKAIFAQ